jgi:hypothetical protein
VPTKAAYELMETNPDVEFDHILTERLGWRSVAEMRRGMSAAEWLSWWVYLARKGQRKQLAAGGE